MVECVSCGEKTPDTGESWAYCAKCERERQDPTIPPKVKEYVGGGLGSLPNKRGELSYMIAKMGYQNTHEKLCSLSVFRHEQGSFGVITNDNIFVIVPNDFELESLFDHEKFRESGMSSDLPKMIESLEPEKYDAVVALQQSLGLY